MIGEATDLRAAWSRTDANSTLRSRSRADVAWQQALLPLAGAAVAGVLFAFSCPPHNWPLAAWLTPALLLMPTALPTARVSRPAAMSRRSRRGRN
jgi:apolipoprotein N-acyltransferase